MTAALRRQIAHEISGRLHVLALLSPGVVRVASAEARRAPAEWAGILSDPVKGPKVAADVYKALWYGCEAPAVWWATPVGVRLVECGLRPAGVVSERDAAAMLGMTRYAVNQMFGSGPIPVVAVAEAAAEPADR